MKSRNGCETEPEGLYARQAPIRVVYLLEHGTLHGGERSLLNLLLHLDRSRFEPIVLAPEQGDLAAALADRGVRHLIFELRRDGHRRPFEDAAVDVALLAREAGATILHANALSTAEYTGLAAARLAPERPAAVAHIRDIQTLKRTRRDRLAQNDALIAVSEATRAHLIGQGLPEELVVTIANGIEPDYAVAEAPASDLFDGDDGRARIVACIGQICLRKAQDVCVEAMIPVLGARPDVHLVVIGARSSMKEESQRFEERLHERATAAGLANRVHFPGYRHDVPAILRRASVLAHAAHQEPLGRVLLEAQIAGTPIAATAVGGTAEIVDHRRTGLLVPKAGAEALGAAVASLLDDPAAARAMARAARESARERFAPARSAGRVMALYERLLRARSGSD